MDPKMKSFLLNVGSTTHAMKAYDPWVEEDLLRASLSGSADDLRRWLRRKTSVLTQRTERFIRRRADDHCECCHRPISWMARCENGGTFGLINPDARLAAPQRGRALSSLCWSLAVTSQGELMDTSTCPDSPHVHPCIAPMPAVALVFDETVAERIATLLARHGLADVPDSLAPAWPAPTGPAAGLDAPQPTGPA